MTRDSTASSTRFVYARTNPEQKLRIVEAWKSWGGRRDDR